MEVTYALINMRVELGMVTKGQLDYPTGFTIRIYMCADANGNPVYFEITGEQVHDSQVAGMTMGAVPLERRHH